MGDSTQVDTGPGTVYVAALGTSEPASATASLASWRDVGYTDGGMTFSYEITNEPVTVDQELDPIAYETTGRLSGFGFNMAEINRQNLALALNAGAAAASTGTLEPPDPGSEVRVMVIHKLDNGALWLFRRCIQASSISIASQKAPQKRLIPVSFRLEKPTGAAPFKVYPSLATAGVV